MSTRKAVFKCEASFGTFMDAVEAFVNGVISVPEAQRVADEMMRAAWQEPFFGKKEMRRAIQQFHDRPTMRRWEEMLRLLA